MCGKCCITDSCPHHGVYKLIPFEEYTTHEFCQHKNEKNKSDKLSRRLKEIRKYFLLNMVSMTIWKVKIMWEGLENVGIC